VVGAKGVALGATNGGSFFARNTGTTADLHAALILDGDTHEFVGGEDGTLRASVDHGITFGAVPVTTKSAIYGLDDL
jgi:hypothetical protein